MAKLDLVARVFEQIREPEVTELALALANLDSPTGREGEVSDAIFDWLDREGFEPRRAGLFPDRANVAARIPGVGGGSSLLLNSHMDTTIASEETLTTPNAGAPEHHSAWREGDYLIGNGVVNNKGVMATWMVACKALHRAGVRLRGDLLMTMVVGEIGVEPVDEFQPPRYLAKEAGARYLVNRGYTADFGVVAEGTDFALGWVEAGKAFFKVSVEGVDPPLYTPYVPTPGAVEESPNAIVRASNVIQAIERWASGYERRHTYECEGGTVVPKVSIGAIRSGVPYKITKAPAICHLYVDVRTNPEQNAISVQRELEEALADTNIPTSVEPFAVRRGYEGRGVEEVVGAVERAHGRVLGGTPGRPITPVTSMWRDSNVFNETGIPTVVYGPGASVGGGNFAMKVESLVTAARVYAVIAMELCGVES
ncbi:MAG: M20/M25/M40 family metallo-hydrolase [Solirubrobacterales bacterium]|nr:M20/M25/M40 family metallo-hydrolase [Solirubrobacterales bacterium]